MKQIKISDETYIKLIAVKDHLEKKEKIDTLDELLSEMIKIIWMFDGIIERWKALKHLLEPLE